MEKEAHLFALRNTKAISELYENVRKAAKSAFASDEEWHQIKMENLINKRSAPFISAIMKNKKIRIVIVRMRFHSHFSQYVCDDVHRGESEWAIERRGAKNRQPTQAMKQIIYSENNSTSSINIDDKERKQMKKIIDRLLSNYHVHREVERKWKLHRKTFWYTRILYR